MDPKVLETQVWLNATYSGVAGWVPVGETGVTGWDVIYGLRRALQCELGISPLASGFGPATRSAFTAQIGTLSHTSSVSQNILWIVSGALFCKGKPGTYKTHSETLTFSDVAGGITACLEDLGLEPVGSDPQFLNARVDVKLMASLLSMDAYVIPWSSGGTASVREVQQWLNQKFAVRRDFALIPCDGLFSRQIQTALLYALQYEIGMPDGTANGNFGPGTKSGLKTQATVGPGSQDTTSSFVRLFQAALRFNRLEVPFDGHFGAAVEDATRSFQSFMALPVNGQGDYATWCNLLVSSGDPDAPTTGFDTSRQLTPASAAGAVAGGYTHVGRYLTGVTTVNGETIPKFLSIDEFEVLATAGLLVFPIMQVWNQAGDMTFDEGRAQALRAVARARAHGFPDETMVYFAVDFDPTGEVIAGPVADFFRGIGSVVDNLLTHPAKAGVYGSRNVCSQLAEEGLTQGSFVAGASTGWSGNMGFPMPDDWHFNQSAVDKLVSLGGVSLPIDRVRVSSTAPALSPAQVDGAPRRSDAPVSSSGIHELFEWLCDAEVVCEIALSQAGLGPFGGFISEFIAHWLRLEAYWDHIMWKAYTPQNVTDPNLVSAQGVCETALATLAVPRPTIGDVPHTAATYLGYATWNPDLGITPNHHGWGDLGGWALDLLQIWGNFLEQSTLNLEDYLAANLGHNDESQFGDNDILADADGWLIRGAGGFSSDACRDLLKMSPAQRISTFYAERFNSSVTNIEDATLSLFDGIDVFCVNLGFTVDQLRDAADLEDEQPMPTPAETVVLAHALGNALTELGT